MEKFLFHYSVLLNEVLGFAPENSKYLLDVTVGGAGHLVSLLEKCKDSKAIAWDRDTRAIQRVEKKLNEKNLISRVTLQEKVFSEAPQDEKIKFDFILADLGVSTFQLDPEKSGMSLFSDLEPDFRMNTNKGLAFKDWLKSKSQVELESILFKFAEEPKAAKLAKEFQKISSDALKSAKNLSEWIKEKLGYKNSKIHPATRIFQAFRMAVNSEFDEIKAFLAWAPYYLNNGGRLAIISFHSIEDRLVKKAFQELKDSGNFKLLTKKPILPSDAELADNNASRSAKLRVIERLH